MSGRRSVVIVGAGVLGLTTAVLLQERNPTTQILMVAAEIPLVPPFETTERPSPDYASMWAGAHFRPTPGASEQMIQEQQFALHTADKMKTLAYRNPESGVQRIIGREIMEYLPQDKINFKAGDIYASSKDDEFRVLDAQELQAGGKWGCEYKTWVVNVHVYCRWLLTNFIRQGGNLVQKRLEKLEDAFSLFTSKKSPLVVNCSGRNFDADPKMNVIRGQTVLVKNTYHKTATRHNHDGSWCFLIPRPLGGGTIVGGTKQLGDWGTEIREEETKKILSAAVRYWPDFVSKEEDFEIVAVNVGRRPWREGGICVEVEKLSNDNVVVHGYGAGARGYELSWGVADKIASLVETNLILPSKI